MFNKPISTTTITSEVADRLFSNITASHAPDQSFLATMRALLHKRLPQSETALLTCKKICSSSYDISTTPVARCMTSFVPDVTVPLDDSTHGIHIIHTVDADAGEMMLDIIKSNAGIGKRYMSDYTRRDDLQVFFARKVKALFYTDASERNTVIFVGRMELKHFHALQVMLPKYLPRLFADHPLTEVEIALLKSTGNKSAVEYELLIETFAKELDIRVEIIRSKLAGFETVFERIRAEELKNEISLYQLNYNNLLTKMREAADIIQECKYKLAGIECSINSQSGDSELMEYFMCNKNLSIVRVKGTAIEFVAHGYADTYDEEAFERYVANHEGSLYNHLPAEITKSQMEQLYKAIFSEGTYKLRICAAFTADMKTSLYAHRNYVFPVESIAYFPNPHIQQHGCIGSNAGRFREYMDKRDYVGAIAQAAVSARDLNFHDSTVMSTFAREFSRTKIRCLEKSDGTLLTPLEAIAGQDEWNAHQAVAQESIQGATQEGDVVCPDPLF